MSPLRTAVADYLSVRRALGYQLARHERLLPQFVDYLEHAGAATVTVEHALAWATLPSETSPRWQAERLSVVRGFASWLAAVDPAAEIPPADLLPCPRQRAVPYLYSDDDVAALLAATDAIRSRLRAATYRTLIGLLAVTGMRIGEALAVDRADVNLRRGRLLVRSGKFDKTRELHLHTTSVDALRGYLELRDRLRPDALTATPALFITTRGSRLGYSCVKTTFRQLAGRAGLKARSAACRPRLHDLRHSFAVNSLLDAYRSGADVHARLPLIATWLGHADPANTYWYLSAAPELLSLAAQRLDAHVGDRR